MTWVKVDDAFYDHPKFVDLEAGEIGLWLLGLAYANRYITDGRIAMRAVTKVCPQENRLELAQTLVERNLWHAPGEVCESTACPAQQPYADGWVIHDYYDQQPTAEDVQRKKREQAEKARKAAEARWGGHRLGTPDGRRNGQANAQRNARKHAHEHEKTALNDAPKHAPADAPSRPVPNEVRDAVLGTSRLSGGAGGTDDDHHVIELAKAACNLIGFRRYSEAVAAGKVHSRKASGQRSYQRMCLTNAAAEQGATALAVAKEHPDWTTEQVADETERRDSGVGDVVQLRVEPPATCRWCHAYLTKHHTEDECSRRPYEEAQ